MVGEAHASSVLFFVDRFFRELKTVLPISAEREGGSEFGGFKLTRLLRAATNYMRHKHDWKKSGNAEEQEDMAVLEAVGVKFEDENVASKVLKVIGIGSYIAFEDEVAKAFVELVLGKPMEAPRAWRNGGLLAAKAALAKDKAENTPGSSK
jgi:hypothetical protein